MGDVKDNTTTGLSSGTYSLFEGMGCVCWLLTSPEDRILCALSQRFWRCSSGMGWCGVGEKEPRHQVAWAPALAL